MFYLTDRRPIGVCRKWSKFLSRCGSFRRDRARFFWRFCNLIFLVVVYFIFIPVFCFAILILWTRIVHLAFQLFSCKCAQKSSRSSFLSHAFSVLYCGAGVAPKVFRHVAIAPVAVRRRRLCGPLSPSAHIAALLQSRADTSLCATLETDRQTEMERDADRQKVTWCDVSVIGRCQPLD